MRPAGFAAGNPCNAGRLPGRFRLASMRPAGFAAGNLNYPRSVSVGVYGE